LISPSQKFDAIILSKCFLLPIGLQYKSTLLNYRYVKLQCILGVLLHLIA
jgi:hypothetical protein